MSNRLLWTPSEERIESTNAFKFMKLARENEIKTVRIILSGKANGLSEESIRERIREMYV